MSSRISSYSTNEDIDVLLADLGKSHPNKSALIRRAIIDLHKTESNSMNASTIISKADTLANETLNQAIHLSPDQWATAKNLASETLTKRAHLVSSLKSSDHHRVTPEAAMAEMMKSADNPVVMALVQLSGLNCPERFQSMKNAVGID